MKVEKLPQLVVFFLDQNFGWLREEETRATTEIRGIDLAAPTRSSLMAFSKVGAKMALLVPHPLGKAASDVLRQYVPEVAHVIDAKRGVREALEAALKRFSVEPARTLVVAADRAARGSAASQGCVCMPHPALAELSLRSGALRFARLAGDRERFARLQELVPFTWEREANGQWSMLCAISVAVLADAGRRGLRVKQLALDLAVEDVIRIRRDLTEQSIEQAVGRLKVLYSDEDTVLVALGPDDFNDEVPIAGAHGRIEALLPQPELLAPASDAADAMRRARIGLGRWPRDRFTVEAMPLDLKHLVPVLPKCPGSAATLQVDVDRYRGAASLDAAGTIVSRHTQHMDNARVVAALKSELSAVGYCVWTHSFSYAGATCRSVLADLPGVGCLTIDPDIFDRIRDIFARYPLPDPPEPWLRAMRRILGARYVKEMLDEATSPLAMRAKVESAFMLEPWQPWWRKRCRRPGLGAGLVLVGCHLDSLADLTPGYVATSSPAPGADDDASGIAALLALARWLANNFSGKLKHTVRLAFFNAEEQGLIGSKAYAAHLKAVGAPVKAAVCVDMIGYNSDLADIFEIHAGYTDPAVRDASLPIANTIAAWAGAVTGLESQVHQGTLMGGGADRNVYDPAINRGDHAAFHQQGYPAAIVSEDFFANLPSEPGADPNPNYHTANDTAIDSKYAAEITCALGHAVVELALT